MKISLRTQQLKTIFSYEKKTTIEDRPLEIRPYRFIQRIGENEINCFQESIPTTEFCPIRDNGIEIKISNTRFSFPKEHGKPTRRFCFYTD